MGERKKKKRQIKRRGHAQHLLVVQNTANRGGGKGEEISKPPFKCLAKNGETNLSLLIQTKKGEKKT